VKCIYCDHDSKYTERRDRNGQCPTCGKRFAFEPRDGARITDLGFKRAIDAVSANGHVSWGVEHLYYEVGRRIRRARRWRSRLPWVALALDALLIAIAATNSRWGWVIVLALVGIGTSRWALGASRKTMPLSLDAFTKMWATWTRVHSDRTKGLIIRKEPLPRPRPVEGDIALYSFDRAVICDRARTVDLLLANNFHFENNCAVLSIDGYPPGPFDTVRAMLKRNPRLQVFALHDATEAGCRMAYRLAAEAEWFKGQATVVDVGLRPVHAPAFAGLLLEPSGGRVEPGRGIRGDEAQWLSRHVVEVAAIRPEQVLKRLYRAINRRASDGGVDGGGLGASASGQPGETSADAPAAHEGEFGGAGASGGWESAVVDSESFGGDAGDGDGDGDGSG